MSKELFEKNKKNLEIIEGFESYTLYYDKINKTLWMWDGLDFIGMDVDDFYRDLKRYV